MPISKLRVLLVGFFFVFALILLRLFIIQVIRPDTQKDYLVTRRLYPERGKVYDRNGRPIVLNEVLYRLFFEPHLIREDEKTIVTVAKILDTEQASIASKIDKTKKWVGVTTGVTRDEREKLLKTNLPGLGFDEMWSRYYPDASLAAHIVGFVGKTDDGQDIGRSGVEGYYEKELAGLPGLVRSDVDPMGRPIFLGTQERIDPENGRNIYLTIDSAVQSIIKRKLKEGLDKADAREGCAIVANPNTMEILAMSCVPDFDPQTYYTFSDVSFRNPTISEVYEPGSTFKPLILASAIESGVVTANTYFNEDGPVKIGEYSIRTWNNQYEGRITLTRALEKSSNVGMVFIGNKMGNESIYKTIMTYGFGEPTGIDLQGEIGGFIKAKNQWYPIDYATATFGQGLAVTPLQMVRAFSSIINGGKLLKPFVVRELHGETVQKIEPEVQGRTISQKTSDIMKKILHSTIENGETKFLKPAGYQIGGKTGTAQIALAGKYDDTKTIASFIGFSPIKNPQFIGLVVVKEPKASQWGSETAAPIFFEIAKELIVYYNIAPE